MRLNSKITSSVAGASVILSLMGILGKGIGFIREIIYANNFGLSSEFELFLTSAALPVVLNSAAIYLCQHYFIPAFNRIKNESEKAGNDFFNYTFWWFVFGGFIVSGILFFLSNLMLNFYLGSISFELKQKGLQIFLIFLLTIPINAGISVITAYLQANFNFIYPALSQVLLNIVIIVLIILFTNVFQIFILPVSFVAAYLIAFIMLYKPVRNKISFNLEKIFKFRYKLSDVNILISLIFIEVLSLSYILIDRYFIGEVPDGGIAALNYALVIYLLPISIFSIPLITTMFSKFSRSSGLNDVLETDFYNASRINVFIFLPITFLLYLWGDLFLKLFYERGEFSSNDTLLTYAALQSYSIGLIFYSAYLIAVKLLYSINKYNLVLVISIIAFLLKILFNFLLVDSLEQNGLALSTSFIYIFLFFVGLYLSLKQIKARNKFFMVNVILYFVANGTISYIVSYFLVLIFGIEGIISNILQITIFILTYVINSYLLKDKEYYTIKNTMVNILNR